MGAFDDRLAALLTDLNLDALRTAAGLQGQAEAQIRDFVALAQRTLQDADPTSKKQLEAIIARCLKVLDTGYAQVSAAQVSALHDLAALFAEASVQMVNRAAGTALLVMKNVLLPDVAEMAVKGAPSADWWQAQSLTAQHNFARAVRIGFTDGLTNDQIARGIVGKGPGGASLEGPGFLDASLRDARTLVQTSVQTMANSSRRAVFTANDDIVIGLRQISTLDSHTTVQCQARDHKQWDMEGNPVGHKIPYNGGTPVHFGCRSVEVPVLKPLVIDGKEIGGFESSSRASADGPVSSKLDFEAYLDSKSQDWQDEVLGPGRAKLWRDKKLTLADLLDMRGRELTLAQLKAKYQ
jgi:hypothetical protein